MNSGLLATYDPKFIEITFGGVTFFDYADGDFVNITGEDNFESVTGADGSENRVNKNRTGVDVEITLSQTSLTNDLLSAIFATDKLNNEGFQPLTIKDLRGTTLLFSKQAYIKKIPDTGFGNSLGTRQWTLRAPQAEMIVGGNI